MFNKITITGIEIPGTRTEVAVTRSETSDTLNRWSFRILTAVAASTAFASVQQ